MALFRLVTLAEAKNQLSIIDNADDSRIRTLVYDASQIIMDYLTASPAKEALDTWTDTSGHPLMDVNGDPLRVGAVGHLNTAGDFVLDLDTNGTPINDGVSIVPGPIRIATLLVISRLDDDREGKEDPLSPAVKSLLMRSCDPPLA